MHISTTRFHLFLEFSCKRKPTKRTAKNMLQESLTLTRRTENLHCWSLFTCKKNIVSTHYEGHQAFISKTPTSPQSSNPSMKRVKMESTHPDAPVVVTSSPQPLTEFALFSSLPVELQLSIWRRSLPISHQGYRILRVRAIYIPTLQDPQGCWSKPFLKFQLLENIHSPFLKDLSMLQICALSREIFLARFNNSLGTSNGGMIRFADEDIVYISKPSPSWAFLPNLGVKSPSLSILDLKMLREN